MRRLALVACVCRAASADPLVLRGDALATTSSPAGLVTLSAVGDGGPNLSAEAVVWTGQTGATAADRATGDVLVIAVHARALDGRATATIGRFVAMLGALRPVHVDGARARLRLPYRFELEAYAGVPVQPDLGTARAWDWVTGARAARRLGDWGSVGVAYLQQRGDGRLASEEVGVDAGAALGAHADVGGRLAYDLANPGVAEARVTASARRGALRGEVYASYVAASHLLPATSLFTVLGDVPSLRAGATATWRAAPRLDVFADVAVRRSDGDAIAGFTNTLGEVGSVVAPAITLRATLRLDDRGKSALGCELRRDGGGYDGWTGARGTFRYVLPYDVALTGELEIVVPDHDRGLGRAWPWTLVAASRAWGRWRAAVAVEAQMSAEEKRRLDALAQLGTTWSVK